MNPLTDVIPAQYRKYAYAALFLASLAIGCWQAAEGNWGEFIASLVTALFGAVAASNTSESQEPAHYEEH